MQISLILSKAAQLQPKKIPSQEAQIAQFLKFSKMVCNAIVVRRHPPQSRLKIAAISQNSGYCLFFFSKSWPFRVYTKAEKLNLLKIAKFDIYTFFVVFCQQKTRLLSYFIFPICKIVRILFMAITHSRVYECKTCYA